MSKNYQEIELDQGDDLYVIITITAPVQGSVPCSSVPVNISGSTFTGQIIDNFQTQNVLAVFQTQIINASGGQFSIYVPLATINSLSVHTNSVNRRLPDYNLGVYTIDWFNPTNGLTLRFLQGNVKYTKSANVISS